MEQPEDIEERLIEKVLKRINGSGHVEMIKGIYQQFFNPTDNKKNTHCIYGKSNTGKT